LADETPLDPWLNLGNDAAAERRRAEQLGHGDLPRSFSKKPQQNGARFRSPF
jgi:hypothetical protein